MKIGLRRAVIAIGLAAAATAAFAQTPAMSGTPEEQAACRPDVRKFCHDVKMDAGNNAFLACLQTHRNELSAKCGAVLKNHGA